MTDNAPQEMASDSWKGEQGEKWNHFRDQFEGMIEEIGKVIIDYADFAPGERVIDIGCGAGATSLKISELVGDSGHVTGLDLSPTLIDTCRQRAEAAGLGNIDFIEGDAGAIQLAGYDHLFSRFGVMFFEEPVKAFANMKTFLRPGGKVTFACWGPPAENPWVFDLMGIVSKYVQMPPPVANAPGPFAFADPDYLRQVLGESGYLSVSLTPGSADQWLGGPGATPQQATAFLAEATFLGRALEGMPAAQRQQALEEITSHLGKFHTDRGVALKGSIWMVKAST